MERSEYRDVVIHARTLRQSDMQSSLWLLRAICVTGVSVSLSLSTHPLIWLAGQLLYIAALYNWFSLLHDTGHGTFFRSTPLNYLIGFISSMFILLPFEPWRVVHKEHHKWTGYMDLDPTKSSSSPDQLSPAIRKLCDLVWKYWIPFFTPAFAATVFWNPKLTAKYAENRREQVLQIVSLLVIAVPYLVLTLLFGVQFLKLWLVGLVVALILGDPFLLSQHTYLPWQNSTDSQDVVRTKSHRLQDEFTRQLIFPEWISKYVLMNFDKHVAHHLVPHVPCYYLDQVKVNNATEMHWVDWYVRAKRIPGHVLLCDYGTV